jgi:hypothetical protein
VQIGYAVAANGARGLIHADGEALLPIGGRQVEAVEVQDGLILSKSILGRVGRR